MLFGHAIFWFVFGPAMPNHMQINAKPSRMFACKPEANQITKLLSNQVHTKIKQTSITEPIFIHSEHRSIIRRCHIITEQIA